MDEFKGMPPDRGPQTRGEKFFVLALCGCIGGLMLVGFVEDFTPRMWSIPFFLISWPILLVLHEFGHGLIAKWLGWEVEMVAIGTGAIRARRRIFGMLVEFRAIPLSGFVQTRATDLIQPRLKNCLIYAAGPGIEIVAVILALLFVGSDTLLNRTDGVVVIAVQAFCVAALMGAVINLIPFPHRAEQGTVWSDGMGMIMSWQLPDAYFANQIKRGADKS